MKAKLKTKWLKALRSGQYKQTKGRLRINNSYCPIGVLCDIGGWGEWHQLPREGTVFTDETNVQNRYYLTELGHKKSGLSFAEVESIANMNDTEDRSFSEIADHIEKEL